MDEVERKGLSLRDGLRIKIGRVGLGVRLEVEDIENELEIEDLMKYLRIEDVREEMKKHASLQVWFEMLLSEIRKELMRVKEIEMKKYMAHCRRYARWAFRWRKQEERVNAIEDFVVETFGGDRNSEIVQDNLFDSFLGKKLLEGEKRDVLEENRGVLRGSQEFLDFVEEALSVGNYCEIMRYIIELEDVVEKLDAVVDGFKQKGIFLSSLDSDERVLVQSAGVGREYVEGIVEEVKERVLRDLNEKNGRNRY